MEKSTPRSVPRFGKQVLALTGIISVVGVMQQALPGSDKEAPRTSSQKNSLAQSCPVTFSEQVAKGESEEERAARFISCAGFLQ